MFKKYAALAMAAAIIVLTAFSGCAKDSDTASDTSSKTDSTASQTASSEAADLKKLGLVADYFDDTEHEVGYQLESPDVGEEVAIVHTTMGDISMRFFPEAAPKTVENFLTLAKNGYYDGIIFHRVINNFMIQGGDPTGTGTGGDSVSGEDFEDEFSNKLFNIRGSVAMANSGADTNGSQFFINQAPTASFEGLEANWRGVYDAISSAQAQGQLEQFIGMYGQNYNAFYNVDIVPESVKELYKKQGGNPSLDGAFNALDRGHTVFAQVYDGMDVVDKIAAVETDPSNDKPLKEVKIESIEVTTFGG